MGSSTPKSISLRQGRPWALAGFGRFPSTEKDSLLSQMRAESAVCSLAVCSPPSRMRNPRDIHLTTSRDRQWLSRRRRPPPPSLGSRPCTCTSFTACTLGGPRFGPLLALNPPLACGLPDSRGPERTSCSIASTAARCRLLSIPASLARLPGPWTMVEAHWSAFLPLGRLMLMLFITPGGSPLEGHCATLFTVQYIVACLLKPHRCCSVGSSLSNMSVPGLLEGRFLQVFSVLSSAAEARSAKYEAVEC